MIDESRREQIKDWIRRSDAEIAAAEIRHRRTLDAVDQLIEDCRVVFDMPAGKRLLEFFRRSYPLDPPSSKELLEMTAENAMKTIARRQGRADFLRCVDAAIAGKVRAAS